MALQDFTLNLKANTLALDKSIKSVTDRSYTVKIKADGSSMRTLTQDVSSADGKLKGVVKTMEQVDAQGKVINTTITQNAKTVKSWGQEFSDAFTKVLRFGSVTAIIGAMTQAMREAVQVVKEFDDAFTELAKVSELSGDSLKEYVNGLDEIGERVARTRTDLVDAVTTATKAGFSSNDAKLIAEYSALLQNTFDEQISGADATSILVSQLKAFNMTATDTEQILDKINKVSATQAVSSGDLTSALKVSSSALATYNNTIDETIALITAGTTIMQGRSQQVGRGLQTIASRLVKNEEELAKYGVAIKDSNGNLLSTYEILEDLKPAWDSMSDSERVALGNTLAGVNQYKVLASVMSAFDVAIETNASSLQAHGETMKQNAIYMDSMEAKITTIKAEMQKLVLGDGGLQSFGKVILDVGINILKFANSDIGQLIIKLGLASTAIIVLGKAIKGLTIVNMIKDTMALQVALASMSGVAITSTQAFAASLKVLTTAWITSPFGMATLAITGIVLIAKAIDALTVSFDEQVEKLEEAKSAYESTQTELKNIEEQLQNVRDRIDEINSKDDLSVTDEAQLRLLKEQEASLEHQLILQQELNKEAKDQATSEAKKTLSKSFESAEAFGVTTDYFQSGMPVTTVGKGTLPEAIDSLNQKMAEEQDVIDSLIAKRNELEASNQKESDEYNELGAQLDSHIQKRDELRAATAEYVNTMDEAISVADQEDETIKNAISIRDVYDEIIKRITGSEEEAQDQASQTGDAYDDESEDVESLDNSLKELAQSVGLSVEELQNLAEVLGVTNEVAAQIQSSWNDWNDTVDDIQSAYQTLASAVEEYNTQGYYSTDTLQSLLALSPEYLGMLQEENGKIVLNEEAIRNKVIAQAEEAKQIAYDTAIKRLNAIASGDTATATEKAGEASSNAASEHTKNAQALMGEAQANLYLATAEARRRGLGTAESEIQTILSDLSSELSAIDKWSESLGKSFEGSMGKATKATNKTTSAVNKQKEALQNAKKALQEERDAKVKEIENQLKALEREYKANKKAIEAQRDEEIDSIEAQIDAIEKERDERKKYWEEQLSNLEAQNQTVEDAIDLQQKLSDLAKAQQTQKMILKDGRFVYSSDESAVTEAQQNLDDFLRQKEYEKQKAYLEKMRDMEDDNYSQRIDALNDFKDERKAYYEKLLDDLQDSYEKNKQSLEDYKDALKDNYDQQIDDLENHASALSSQYSSMLSSQKSYQDSSLSSLRSYVNDYNNTLSNLSVADKGSAVGMPTNVPTYKDVYNSQGEKITSTGTGKKGSGGMPSNVPTYKKVYAHANGSNIIGSDQIALVGDNPKYRELVIGSKLNNDQGTIMSLKRGSGVVNAGATNTLASIFNALKGQNTSAQPISNSSNATNITIGSISLPQIKDGNGFIDYLQNFSNDITQMSFART